MATCEARGGEREFLLKLSEAEAYTLACWLGHTVGGGVDSPVRRVLDGIHRVLRQGNWRVMLDPVENRSFLDVDPEFDTEGWRK